MYDYHDRTYTFYVIYAGGEKYGLMSMRGEWLIKNLAI